MKKYFFLLIGSIFFIVCCLSTSLFSKKLKLDLKQTLVSEKFWRLVTPRELRFILENQGKQMKINQIKDMKGQNSLHYAVRYGKDVQLIYLLVEYGIDHTLKEKEAGGTPFHWALIRKDDEKAYEFAKVLIKIYYNNKNINISDDVYGNTPLTWAAYFRASPKLIKLLLDNSADPNQKDNVGDTPLISAAKANIYINNSFINPDTVQLLLDYKAEPTIRNDEGKTVFDYMTVNKDFRNTTSFKKLLAQYQFQYSNDTPEPCNISTYKMYIYKNHSNSCFLSNLSLSNSNLSNSNLSNSNLSNSKLSNSDLSNSNLSNSNLSNSNWIKVKLNNANLIGAVFSFSNLKDIDFSGANLNGANLFAVNLSRSNLKDVNLENVNLNKAVYDSKTTFPRFFFPKRNGMIEVSRN